MKSITESKEMVTEIASMLKTATREQKIFIKGILLGTKVPESTKKYREKDKDAS